MNQYLKTIQDLLQNKQLSEQEKDAVIKAIADADKQWSITDFKLDRTEKVKKTTAILLEETIAELEQKRKAVEAQNRELEIESALERVRSVAMGMKKPEDMLEVCKTISQQLELLHIKEIRNIQTAIFYEATSIYINYEFYRKHDKLLITEVDYDNHPVAQDFADRMTKGPNHVWTHEFKGEEVRDWLTFQKTTNVFIDSYLEKANSLNYYWYSLGPVALGISTYSPLNEEEINLFKRFRNVFELAYRRYIDIEKAQAQAREAQIELALERVRARTMAMQKSGELAETSLVLFQQFKDLGETSEQISIGIFNEDVMDLYSTIYGSQWKEAAKVDLKEPVVMKKIHTAWRNHKRSLVIDLAGKDLQKYNAFRKKLSNLEYKEDRWVIHIAFFSKGVLTFSTTEPHPQETIQLLERFAGVFDQTYTRFLDLQNAEAQARESQIQLALERVRARTMAMQHSDELKNAAALLFQQVKSLGAPAYSCGYNIWEKDDKEFTSWMSTQDGSIINGVPNIPLTEDVNFIRYVESKQNGEQFFVLELRGERMQEHYKYLKTIPAFKAYFDYAVSMGFDLPETQIHHLANFSQGNLLFITLEPCPEFHDVFKRFAAVFEQTYTRFLDLQKAEAQARESQIQLALERVRARTMAMQRSDELMETAAVLFDQLNRLGENIERTIIGVMNEEERVVNVWATRPDGSQMDKMQKFPIDEPILMQKVYAAWRQQKKSIIIDLRGEELESYFQFLKGRSSRMKRESFGERRVESFSFFSKGILGVVSADPETPPNVGLYERFSAVFEQTYTRFLDLQKAEAQAREAQIEAALERVRARTMAMHSSEDVSAATTVLFNELFKLGIETMRCGILIIDDDQTMEVWTTSSGAAGQIRKITGSLDMKTHPLLQGLYRSWKQNDEFYSYELEGQGKLEYYKFLSNSLGYSGVTIDPNSPDHFSQVFFFKEGGLFTFSVLPHSEEIKQVLKKFTAVFSLTFRRYQDLKKAEAQAREAQIEASLERVRARTMAMHSSEDVSSATATMFNELEKLNIQNFRGGILNIRPDQTMEVWSVNTLDDGRIIRAIGDFDMTMHPFWRQLYQGWINNDESFLFDMSGKDKEDYVRILDARRDYLPNGLQYLPDCIVQSYFFGEGAVWTFSLQPHPEEDKQVMKRFASVFSLTFRRYKDLQKAEAQARESQIEAALERVRARAMAMHKSDDLKGAVATVFEELDKLNLGLIRCGIAILDKEQPRGDIWITIKSEQGNTLQVSGDESLNIHPLLQGAYDAWLRHEDYSYVLEHEDLEDYYQAITKTNFQHPISATFDSSQKEQQQHYFNAVFQDGSLFAFLDTAFTDEAKTVMKRFANVFNLTYKRFLDLQKAEEQAREATIEAALEKVRGKAMAMHNSNDLSVTASMVFTELRKLGINSIRCGVGLLSKETRKAQLYLATSSTNGGDSLSLIGWFDLSNHPVAEKIYESWLKNEDYFPVLTGEQLKSYYENLLPGLSLPSVPGWQDGQKEYGTFLPFSVGSLNTWSEAPYNDTEIKILKRFATIIDLTFRRYIELQKSEANAREAVKQAALDRVRAEIASMRTISDLDRITPLIWNELNILGIPFIRCGVFIMDESQQLIHTFLSTPDGKAIAAFHLPYDTPGHFPDLIDHWHNKKIYVSRWSQDDFLGIANTLVGQGAITTKEQYLGTLPKAGFYLHFLPFLQGLLYVGNTEQLGQEEIILIQHVADAFSTAYARYEDFNKLEAAKQQVDKTLVDLKQAQTQLVQSEKMASLGELTAGIAHEIQNPLNFVNNFSDVSNELLEEMKGELASGNMQQAIAIADDVRQNLEKILHHGKRADAIVKGMLQHSRASSGQKEPTDINALADEYLRLAYHGLRAKEKSFNAKFETDFDQSIGKINIIPQEVGRVVLNLINNAFYAVSEKKKADGEDYEPVVTITTRKRSSPGNGDAGLIEINVSDNGIGISEGTRDKIFQPFFTTKPSGQGTGLGLSLAYDIITKGHGGDIMVKSIPGKGSEFIIHLPANATL